MPFGFLIYSAPKLLGRGAKRKGVISVETGRAGPEGGPTGFIVCVCVRIRAVTLEVTVVSDPYGHGCVSLKTLIF